MFLQCLPGIIVPPTNGGGGTILHEGYVYEMYGMTYMIDNWTKLNYFITIFLKASQIHGNNSVFFVSSLNVNMCLIFQGSL